MEKCCLYDENVKAVTQRSKEKRIHSNDNIRGRVASAQTPLGAPLCQTE